MVCNAEQNQKCFHSLAAAAANFSQSSSSSASSPQRGSHSSANRPRAAEADVTLSNVEYPMSRVAGLCTSYSSTVVDALFPHSKDTFFQLDNNCTTGPRLFSAAAPAQSTRLSRIDDTRFVDAYDAEETSILYAHAYFSTKVVHEIVDSTPQTILQLLASYPQLPRLTDNGVTHRPEVGRNHCSLFLGSEVQAVRVCLVVNGNEFPCGQFPSYLS